MKLVVADCEADSLNPTRIWVIVCKDVETGEVLVFREPDKHAEFKVFASTVDGWIGHNWLGFDLSHINRLVGTNIDPRICIDTLVISRLVDYSVEGGHSLDAWGRRLGDYKGDFNDWSHLSEEMVEYCIQDVNVTHKLYQHFLPYITSELWKDALRVEHDAAWICQGLNTSGFHFNIDKCKELWQDVSREVEELDKHIEVAFPPKVKFIKEVNPRATKFGTLSRTDFRWLSDGDLSSYNVDCPFSRIEYVPFNPGSPSQIVERLNEAGWKPTEKTKGHLLAERNRDKEALKKFRVVGWKVSEQNLLTLPDSAPEAARSLAKRILLASRKSDLEEWIGQYNPETHRINGQFNHIGAWTHRMSHNNPNLANIPTGKAPYAHAMRSLWCAAPARYLVGVDAEGIQLRILAHYINDERFTFAVTSGNKEDGTDPHTLNQKALGTICRSRDDAKTFIYAWLLGAGVGKVAQILGCTYEEAKEACENFIKYYPGLKKLKDEDIPRDAANGYFRGFDGRYVRSDEYHMLAGYLQNGESIIMKKANKMWRDRLDQDGVWYNQVNFVHDEWQTETNRIIEEALHVAQVQADSIKQAGLLLGVRCPLAGSYLGGGIIDPRDGKTKLAIGDNWSETH